MELLTGDLSKEEPSFTDITWQIHDFLAQPTTVDFRLISPSFSFANAVWQIELFPNGSKKNRSRGSIDLFVTRLKSSVPYHKFTAKWFLKTSRGKEHEGYSLDCLADDNDPSHGVVEFFERSLIKARRHFLLPNGTLTVGCVIRMKSSYPKEETPESLSLLQQIGGEGTSKKQRDASAQTDTQTLKASPEAEVVPETSSCVHKLQSDYKKLLESEEDTDVCLKVSDKEYRAHRCILRARSSVFSAMFKHDTEEKASGEVVIKDMDPESFPDFLQHMYSGRVDALSEENVFNLFTAADKYDMTDLRSDCKKFIEKNLSVDTFCDVMVLALSHQEAELLKNAIDFFVNNMAEIIVTVKWQIFSKEYNTEANELLIKAIVPTDKKIDKS